MWRTLSERWSWGPLLLTGLALVLLAELSRRLRIVTIGGAFAGTLLALGVVSGLGWRGLSLLAVLVAVGGVVTRLGWRRKRRRGVAQAHGGRRTAAEVVAKGVVAAGCALAALSGARPFWTLLYAAAVAGAAADTVATEVGKLVAGPTWRPLPPRRVPSGAPGGVSLAGTGGALLAAVLVACCGLLVGLLRWNQAVIVATSGWVAAMGESLLRSGLPGARGAPLLANLLLGVLAVAVAAVLAFLAG